MSNLVVLPNKPIAVSAFLLPLPSPPYCYSHKVMLGQFWSMQSKTGRTFQSTSLIG